MVREGVGHYQETVLIHGDLSIVMLIHAFVRAVFHDARVRIGEVVLILVARSRRRRLGGTSAGLASGLPSFLFSLSQLGGILGLFRRIAFLGTRFQHLLGLGQVDQPPFPKGDFVCEVQPVGQIALLQLFAQHKQLVNLLAQLTFEFKQTFVTDGMALGGIRMELASIQTDVAQVQGPRFLGHQQDLDKQGLEIGQKRLPKVGDRVVVRMQTPRNEPKRDRFIRCFFEFAGTEYTGRVAIQEQAQQDFGINRLAAHWCVARIDSAQVQLSDDRDDEARQVIGRQAFLHSHRLVQSSFVIDGFEFPRHAH